MLVGDMEISHSCVEKRQPAENGARRGKMEFSVHFLFSLAVKRGQYCTNQPAEIFLAGRCVCGGGSGGGKEGKGGVGVGWMICFGV
jgi:hypothetical protein